MKVKGKDAAVVAVTAVATAGLVLSALLAAPLVGGPASPVSKENPWPVLKQDPLEFSLRADKMSYRAGEQPTLELTVENKGEYPADATVTVRMSSLDRPEPESRMMPRPKEVFTHEYQVSLGTGETKTISIPTGVALTARNLTKTPALALSPSASTAETRTSPALRTAGTQVTLQVSAGDRKAASYPIEVVPAP